MIPFYVPFFYGRDAPAACPGALIVIATLTIFCPQMLYTTMVLYDGYISTNSRRNSPHQTGAIFRWHVTEIRSTNVTVAARS